MNSFLKIQLNRACYVSLLNANEIKTGVVEYKNYVKKLNLLMFNPFLTKKCLEEKKKSKEIFVKKFQELAKKSFDEKKYHDALEKYKIIFDVDSKNVENIKNYIVCLEKLEQFDIQFELSKYLISIDKTADSHKILSNAYNKIGDYKNAIKYYNKYFELSKKLKMDAGDYNTIGCHYFNQYVKGEQMPDDAKNALEYFEKTVELVPNNKAYLKNTIVAAMKAKNYEVEKKYWDAYFKEGYADKEDEFTYSASCMRNGDIKGWGKYYSSRFEKNSPAPYPDLGVPLYTGKEDLSDKTLMIHSEQGYGDNFLMWGYMPRMVKLAKKVIYYIQNNAYELVKDNDFGVEVYCKNIIDEKNLKFDYQLPCMSIPIVLGLDKNTLSVEGGYIKPNDKLVQEYKEKYFNNNKMKIAIAYKGVVGNQKRDIPIESLKLLDKLQNVQLYCFTKDVEDEELKAFKKNKVVNIAKSFDNFAQTAAALQNCDLVISSDNCILNLAGAIGKKTFGAFNYHYEFRWYDLTGEDCGWFKCVKPFVNNEYNDWNKTMNEIVKKTQEIQKAGQL